MVDVNIHFFGWLHNPEKNHDKVWGYFTLEDRVYVFWGRRGKTMQFQRKDNRYVCSDIAYQKKKKGYINLTGRDERIDSIFPEFDKHLKSNMFDAKMMDKIRGEGLRHRFSDDED